MSVPRNLFVLLLAAMAACSSSSAYRRIHDEEWLALQRARLRALRMSESEPLIHGALDASRGGDRVPHHAGADEVAHAPSIEAVDAEPAAALARRQPPQGQEPAPRSAPHLDDLEPPRRRGVKDTRLPYSARAGVGIGNLRVHTKGTRQNGDDSVVSTFGVVEAGEGARWGPGVRFDLLRSGDALFAGELMNDGQQVRPADARADAFDCNPYFVWRPEVGDDFELPIRLGAFVDTLRVQHGASPVRRSWFGYGGRVEAEPTWTFAHADGARWDLRGLVGFDVGGARFRENYVGGSGDDTVLRLMGELGLGVRMTSGNFVGEVDYRYRGVDYGATSTPLLGDDRRTEVRSGMLFLQAGVRF